jgi:hypothetical protein
MRKRKIWLILAAAAIVLSAFALHYWRGQVWDYSFCGLEKPRDMQELYEMGDEGWEVAGVFRDWHGKQCALLKRKR